MFADDIKICTRVGSYEGFTGLLEDITKNHQWATCNHMLLNLEKTVVMPFSRKTSVVKYTYEIGGNNLRRVSSDCDSG